VGDDVVGAACLHEETKKIVRIGIVGSGSEVLAGGGDGQHGKQIGVGGLLTAFVDDYPDVRGKVTAVGAVFAQTCGDAAKGIRGT
jgi:hypothetical protein